ncbi:hypothetical protein [Vibrio coralliilyticus]|uniref:hypothetical protein n=1 Tax=Vibrio coralliilyticus TaxID=190893 RepID=UPI001E38E0DD|nr:hypothetical protein [Vibrio coralliilyticus]MCC2524182.1 hypothetical protein [Vibrio coralliilyticus]
MDYFESIIKTLLEADGYWVKQSFKVNVTKQEKRDIGKHSIPRPEMDLIAYNPTQNQVIVMEAKSYLDSPGVKYDSLLQETEIPEGRYKLFTCENYRNIVLNRLKLDLLEQGLCNEHTSFVLGLAAGKIYKSQSAEIVRLFKSKSWVFWSPESIKEKVIALSDAGYENDPVIITTKILMR